MKTFSRFARYFMEVARVGSLRKAAETLHVSASAIDRQILMAEDAFETALFERLPAGLKLTAAGELLLADLRRWHKDYSRTLERFDELRGLRRGNISLAIIDALSEGFVARALARLGESYPGLRFDIRVVDNSSVAQLLAGAEVDLGLMLVTPAHAKLEVLASQDVPLGLVVPPEHELARRASVALSQTTAYRHLTPAEPLMVHDGVRELYERSGLEGIAVMHCNDVRMIRSLIREGAGVSVLSRLDVFEEISRGELVFVPLSDRHCPSFRLALCAAPQRQLSRSAQLLLEALSTAMTELTERGKE